MSQKLFNENRSSFYSCKKNKCIRLLNENKSSSFYPCKTRKRSLKINRNSHRLELETPLQDYTLAHWSTQYENQFTLSFFYLGKKTNKNIVFLKKIIVLVLHVVGTNVEGKIIFWTKSKTKKNLRTKKKYGHEFNRRFGFAVFPNCFVEQTQIFILYHEMRKDD